MGGEESDLEEDEEEFEEESAGRDSPEAEWLLASPVGAAALLRFVGRAGVPRMGHGIVLGTPGRHPGRTLYTQSSALASYWIGSWRRQRWRRRYTGWCWSRQRKRLCCPRPSTRPSIPLD